MFSINCESFIARKFTPWYNFYKLFNFLGGQTMLKEYESKSQIKKIIANNKQTAKLAEEILIGSDASFKVPNATERKNLAMAFAKRNKVIYGRAFDMVKCPTSIDLMDFQDTEVNWREITLCEVKSTSRKNVDDEFKGFFFSISTAELLVAQSLRDQYKFVFVNNLTRKYKEYTLERVYQKSKKIYPTWSISF